ncbi:hypothetical protein B0H11DRAFT_1936822 [Mycena galericulata]|nr:hypothetical protein B0H11DRAFT_1936822 [Mycena galericulata]
MHFLPALPTETWSRILYIYCGQFDVTPREYNISREVLRRKNSGWRRLIDTDSIFWCRVAITTRSSVREVQEHVIHIARRTMHISIDFSSYTSITPSAVLFNATLPRFRHANTLLASLAPTSHLWRHVSMVAGCMTYMKIIVDTITGLSVPSLQYFALHCHAYSREEYQHPIFSDPLNLFDGAMPQLSHLRITNAPLPRGGQAMFGSLTKLEVTNVPETRWPTSTAFVSLLTVAKLTSMTFENFGVRDPANFSLSHPFSLPYLTSLRLFKSKGTDTILAALRGAATPSLVYLLLHGFNGAAYPAITENLRDIDLVEKLLVHGSTHIMVTADQTLLLLRRLPKLLQLDVGFNGSHFISVIAENPEIVPHLQTLAVGANRLSMLHTCMIERADQRRVRLNIFCSQ